MKDLVILSLLFFYIGIYFGSMGCGIFRCLFDMLIFLNGSFIVFFNVFKEDDFKLYLKCFI